MHIGIKDNKIKFYSETTIDPNIYDVDEVRETEDKYMLSSDCSEYILYNEDEKRKQDLQTELYQKENDYQMNRWQREMILAEGSGASEFSKTRAQELENLAEQIRHKDNINSIEDNSENTEENNA